MADQTSPPPFDVFLSHNSKDKPAVIALARRLKENGVKVWLDAWELRPGHPWQEALEQIIKTTRSAVVVFGPAGIGPWEDMEMRACLDGFVKRRQPVIPVLLPGCPETPVLPLLLEQFTWVDCREGKEEDGFYRLIWGITGKKPNFINPGNTDGPPVKPVPPPAIPIPYLHGWPADQIKALQQETATALAKPVIFRDAFLQLGGAGPEMAVIPAGSFIMGSSPASEAERLETEGPQHFVTFSTAFAIGRYAVTFEEYDRFCLATRRSPVADAGWGRGRRPVINVSWQDAQAYCVWLAGQTGKPYHLPTEAEWEYACRAGTETPFHCGDTISPKQANYDGNYPYNGGAKGEYRKKTLPVGQFEPNALGLYDMHGNVWEWVEDAWHDSHADAPADGSAWESAETGAGRVLRGGSWLSYARRCRSAYRLYFQPDFRYYDTGFRCARVQA